MKSNVFFIKAKAEEGEEKISQKAVNLFKTGFFLNCFQKGDFTAVKVHIGEPPSTTYLRPGCIKGLIKELLAVKTKPFITDTSTLYTGRRYNAIDHSILASEHGFDFAGLGIPFIAPDGLFGTSELSVQINGELNNEVFIAEDIVRCQSMLSIAHFTGHIATGAAATLKTLGMGCSSRKGKMRQHASLKPSIKDNCTRCGECFKYCPADAITINDVKAHINRDKCIGCAECLAVCRFGAVKFDWGTESKMLQKNIAEHALGAVKGKDNRIVFFNFLISITADCDCMGKKNISRIADDIGILASKDPVAVDKASIDIIEKTAGKTIAELIGQKKVDPIYQIKHAEKIGLGNSDYELVQLD